MGMAQIARTTGLFAILAALTCGAAWAQQPANHVVYGQVRTANNAPAAGYTVRLANKDGGRDIVLGQAVTDAAGHYRIGYSTAPLGARQAGRFRKHVTLVVQVLSPHRASLVLARSAAIHKIGQAMVVNLTLARAPTRKRFKHK